MASPKGNGLRCGRVDMPLIVNLRVGLQLYAHNFFSVVAISKYWTDTMRSNVQVLVGTKRCHLDMISNTNNYVKIFNAKRHSSSWAKAISSTGSFNIGNLPMYAIYLGPVNSTDYSCNVNVRSIRDRLSCMSSLPITKQFIPNELSLQWD